MSDFRMTSSSDEGGGGGGGAGAEDPLRILMSNDSSSGDERRRREDRMGTTRRPPVMQEQPVPMDIDEDWDDVPAKVELPPMMLSSKGRDEASERALIAARKLRSDELANHEADRKADKREAAAIPDKTDIASVLEARWSSAAEERNKHVDKPPSPPPPRAKKKKKKTKSPKVKKEKAPASKPKAKRKRVPKEDPNLVPATVADVLKETSGDGPDKPVDADLILRAAADFEEAMLQKHLKPLKSNVPDDLPKMPETDKKKKRKARSKSGSSSAKEHPNKVDPKTPPVKRYLGDFVRLMVCNMLWAGPDKPNPNKREVAMLELIMNTAKAYVEAGKALQKRLVKALRKIAKNAGNEAVVLLVDALTKYPEVHVQPTVRSTRTDMTVDVWTGNCLTGKSEYHCMSNIVINSAKPMEEACSVMISKQPATIMSFVHYLSFFHEYSHKFIEAVLVTDPEATDEERKKNTAYQLTPEMNFEETWATLAGEVQAKRTNTLSWFKSGGSTTAFTIAVCRVRDLNEYALRLTKALEEEAEGLPDVGGEEEGEEEEEEEAPARKKVKEDKGAGEQQQQ